MYAGKKYLGGNIYVRSGILAHLGDITAEQIREERLAKYLK